MNDGGESLKTIQKALGHADISITAASYTPVDGVEAVRQSVEAVNARMLAAAKGGAK
jgi:site-specific recombinase XerD